MFRPRIALAVLGLLMLAAPSRAAEPLPHLAVTRKVPLPTPATYAFRFSLWNAPSGAERVFLEQKAIALASPTLAHRLGSVDPLGNPVPVAAFAEQLYLQVEVRTPAGEWRRLGAREPLAAAPYAIATLAPGPAGPQGPEGATGPQGPEGATGPQGEGFGLSCAAEETLVWREGAWRCVAFPASGCAAGDVRLCYEGDVATLNVGACRAGVSACGAGGTWGPCTGQVRPAAGDTCAGDLDCDGAWNQLDAPGCTPFYADADADGLGAAAASSCLCAPTAAFPAAAAGDCNDADADVKGPTKPFFADADADGFRDCAAAPKLLCAPEAPHLLAEEALCDCDDTTAADPAIPSSRGYTIADRGLDADHDNLGACGVALGWFCPGNDYTARYFLSHEDGCDCDDADPGAAAAPYYCLDADGDGAWGQLRFPDQQQRLSLCGPVHPYNTPCGEGPDVIDCDDSDPAVVGDTFCPDGDGDGYRGTSNSSFCWTLCVPVPPFTAPADGPEDCDDADPALTLDATWFVDADGDGLGSDTVAFSGCSGDGLQTGAVRNSNDCDDADPDPALVETRWCTDADADGYRSANCPPDTRGCGPTGSYVLPQSAPLDCDETNPEIPATIPCP